MVERFFQRPLRIRSLRDGPGGELLERFANALCEGGYAKTTARRHIRAAEHLIYWATQERVPLSTARQTLLEGFERHLARCRCPGYGQSDLPELIRGARLFLEQQPGTEPVAACRIEAEGAASEVFSEFCDWMRRQRGTTDATLCAYRVWIEDLGNRFGEDFAGLDARSLRKFVLEKSGQTGWAATKKCVTALRLFVRFLTAEGRCPAGLDAAIPAVVHWRLSSLPRYVHPQDVERIIGSCDLGSPVGRRDRAILLLLARLGLRAGDIVGLRLSDIDWAGASVSVSGKTHRETRLPLTQEVGEAIVEYLRDGRPPAQSDALFLRSRAPVGPFASHAAVSVLVAQAMRRAGVVRPSRGAAHVLRHSVATSMLREGASLQEIAHVLRHRSIATTEIYAKVDVTMLKQIAQPWPEVPSC